MFQKAFGDANITPDRIYKSIAQFGYTLISANSKYDKLKQNSASFTQSKLQGYQTFQQKCGSCHGTELFTGQSFRNIGFPINTNTNEAGRGRFIGIASDFMSFRVPLYGILNIRPLMEVSGSLLI
ncbi:cytochrome c peroxidase [Flavobacterium sp. LAR06]|uniref:cytochrome c peroxidase n=1 Tax=Flavobacterium sp. LAR06 TaxID=3064897 RepID=UPI0035C076E3